MKVLTLIAMAVLLSGCGVELVSPVRNADKHTYTGTVTQKYITWCSYHIVTQGEVNDDWTVDSSTYAQANVGAVMMFHAVPIYGGLAPGAP